MALANAITAAVRSIDPNQPIADVQPMEALIAEDLAQPRFTMWVLGGFAAIALLLAAIGLYGVMALNVAHRTREIAIRMALGAQQKQVLGLIMRRGMALTGAGLAIGIAFALAGTRALRGLLFGVAPTDPLTLLSAAVFLTIIAALATYIPARRAVRVDPLVALRYE